MAEGPNDWERQVGLATHAWKAAEDPVLIAAQISALRASLLFRQSRAFGVWLRHEWFDPLGAANRGFTPAMRFQGQ